MRGRSKVCAAAAIALGGAFAPAASEARTCPPQPLASIGSATEPVLASSPRGGSVVAWYDRDVRAIQARRIGPRGGLGAVRRISGRLGTFGEGLDVAIDRTGRAVLAWFDVGAGRRHSIYVRSMSRSGRLGPVRKVAALRQVIDRYEVEVALDASGAATVVWPDVLAEPVEPKGWRVLDAAVRLRRLGADDRLGAPVEVTAGDAIFYSPRLAVAPRGAATVAWVGLQDDAFVVEAARVSASGRRDAERQLSVPSRYWSGTVPAVVGDARGTTTVAWSRPAAEGLGTVAQARDVTVGGGIGPLRDLAAASDGIAVTADTGGRALVVMRTGASAAVAGRRTAVDGIAADVWALRGRSGDRSFSMAADPAGRHLTAAWNSVPEVDRGHTRIQSRRISSDGRAGRVLTLADESRGLVSAPVAGVGERDAVVVWGHYVGLRKPTVDGARLARTCPKPRREDRRGRA